MKILQLCYKPPYPPIDGGSMGMHSLTMGLLKNNHEVKVLSFSSYKHPSNPKFMPKDYLEKTNYESIFIDLKINAFDALKCFLTNKSYHAERFKSKEMEERLNELLEEESFDVIQLESIFLASYIPVIRSKTKAKIVLRAPNIEHLIWVRISEHTKNPFKKFYTKHLASTLKRFELEQVNNFDGVYPVTDIDARFFIENGLEKPCIGVPVGIDNTDSINTEDYELNSLFHIGSMNWAPNEQGIKWFIEEVWDEIHKVQPYVKAYFAGRAMPEWMIKLQKDGIIISGEVTDSIEFMNSKHIMIVPLLSGSGIRIKIIEAMSIGKCVIATTQAAEGIMYEDGKNIIIADNPEEFAEAVDKCVKDNNYPKMIGENAYKLINEKYNIEAVANRLVELYNKL